VLHVRVVCPGERTGEVLSVLTADPGVQNVVVLPASARRPDGDAVQFELRPGSANLVLSQLRDFGLDRDGPVVVETVDAIMEDASGTASRGSYHGDVAPVWELVESRIRAGAVYAPSFFVLLVIAGLIGAVGILTNSQILIVGAMVVGPEYNAIMAIALGLERHDPAAVRRGLLALLVGFAVAIAVTFAFGAGIRASGAAPEAFLHGVRPVADLINSPNLFSVVVAVLAAIVGVVSLTEARAHALIGVFISVTTIPAAAGLALSLAFQDWTGARGAFLQLLLNVVLLIVVGALALRGQRIFWRNRVPAAARPG